MFTGYPAPFSSTTAVTGGIDNSPTSLMLTKQFKGLEFNQPVRMLEVTPGHARFQATDPMLIPLLEGTVTLHSQAFARPIVGRIQSDLDAECIFSLSECMEFDWQARQFDRVQPAEPVYVYMHGKHKSARMRLEDLSVQGMGLVADYEVIEHSGFSLGQVVKLDFTLPGTPFYDLPAKVLYKVHLGRRLGKLGLQLTPGGVQRRKLDDFISRRKAEILDEVSRIYRERLEPRGIENLYF